MSTALAPEFALGYVLSGKATFTVQNRETGTRYTYKVEKHKHNDTIFFVSLMTGSDNEHSFSYLGFIRDGKYVHGGRKTRLDPNIPSAKGFERIFGQISKGTLHPAMVFIMSSHCCKCGRKLTVPASTHRGMGPECAKR